MKYIPSPSFDFLRTVVFSSLLLLLETNFIPFTSKFLLINLQLYHEAMIVNLLDIVLFNESAVESLFASDLSVDDVITQRAVAAAASASRSAGRIEMRYGL